MKENAVNMDEERGHGMELCVYRYCWLGDRMIVDEYYRGLWQHSYHGYVRDNGYSVELFPIAGTRYYLSEIPYVRKKVPAREMIREERPVVIQPMEEEYDPEAWNRAEGKQMEGVQLSFIGT